MFKIGDIVINKEEYGSVYRITSCKNNYLGKIVAVHGCEIELETMRAEVGSIGYKFIVEAKYFELYKDNRKTVEKIKKKDSKKCMFKIKSIEDIILRGRH